VCDLNDAFDLSQPTISHHLKVLHEVGLLDRTKRGVWVYYAVRADALVRRAVAELVGTAFLLAAVVGSGIAAARLSPDDVGLQLLENSLVTGAALTALILALQPVSASFNPVVTLVERAFGLIPTGEAVVVVAAQFLGGLVGVVVANLMFDLDAVSISGHDRSDPGLWLGEVVATLGLVVLIFAALRAGRSDRVAVVVGGYITAAYWFTSSTSFANPAVTVARMFSDTFAGIAPSSAPMFVAMQMVGGVLAALLVRLLYPQAARQPVTALDDADPHR
jgi:glycerol uptake facilitator-like aquaporin